jgi:hypothetical protein
MCRNIKRLRHPDHAPTDAELHDAPPTLWRTISWFHKPPQANQDVFDAAVRDISAVARVLFRSLHVHGHTHAAV